MAARQLDLVFLWHMHQPDYRDHANGEFALPWVLLHAIKDYCDMAAHLERYPKVRCVVNFVPVLLEQIEDYCAQFVQRQWRDPLLRLLAKEQLEGLPEHDRRLLLDTCFRSNHHTMLSPYPHYVRLRAMYEWTCAQDQGDAWRYLGGAYFSDLLCWYFLAWSGETERRSEPLLLALLDKGKDYSREDRQALLAWVEKTITALIPRYKALAGRGQIELSATPQTHPLAPLLLDFASARESMPDAALPQASHYPDGAARLARHIELAQQSHLQRFGQKPVGMWPAEGALSTAAVALFGRAGVQWLASGEGVLRNSLSASQQTHARAAMQPWRLEAGGPLLFFREERLSDLIGFEYAKWNSTDAARHLIDELNALADAVPEDETPLVSIILDGENAWEHYPYNGWHFFDALYAALSSQTRIQTTTYAALLQQPRHPIATLPALTAGSWVYGTLSTWIGDAAKNRAWDLLCAAKCAFDTHAPKLDASRRHAAEMQLLHCESSDWFWWFGDYNPAPSVESFDKHYRRILAHLYHLLDCPAPAALDEPISRGDAQATFDGSMRRAS